MYFNPRLWIFTEGLRGRIGWAVALGVLSTAFGIARLALLGWLLGQVFLGAPWRDLLLSLRSGARGYLLKDMEPDQLIESLHQIMAGQTAIAPEMTGVLAKVVQGEESSQYPGDRFSELTPRELEILCHLAEGQSNKAIARDLGITDGTVKLHVRSILRKLQVRSRVEAAVLAVEEDICSKNRLTR